LWRFIISVNLRIQEDIDSTLQGCKHLKKPATLQSSSIEVNMMIDKALYCAISAHLPF
jgi:hypothetical protein